MSVETSESASHALHSAQTHPGHAEAGAAGHGTKQSYLVGFALSVLLTAVPFALVMAHTLSASAIVPTVVALGLVQIVVHLVYFLHMNTSSSQTWNNAAFAFTLVVACILVAGSLWIMYHLNTNMMPGMMMPNG